MIIAQVAYTTIGQTLANLFGHTSDGAAGAGANDECVEAAFTATPQQLLGCALIVREWIADIAILNMIKIDI